MANIKSQIKRNSRSQRERFENRHYTSQIKTYFRRLETAVTAGDADVIDAEFKKLVSLIDKAVKRGALHANTGARKKSRAERMRRAVAVA
jgi:small subunit ribosomal protein S20